MSNNPHNITIDPKHPIMKFDTVMGKLCAEFSADTDYPDLYVYLERPDGEVIDLTVITEDEDRRLITAYLYADTSFDSPTQEHTWTEEEINIE